MTVKFLVADDSSVMRMMIISTIFKGDVFNETNTQMIQASNGEEGLEKFRTERPQVVLSDGNMPKMDGFQMVQKIRELDKQVPIIMVMTEGAEDRVHQALKEGLATDYVVKPLKTGVLEEKLLRAFQALKDGAS